MRDDATGRYLPVIYPEELPFWEGAKKRELHLGQKVFERRGVDQLDLAAAARPLVGPDQEIIDLGGKRKADHEG